jgi:alkylation response protein AidB-like acyl-CoA dehydrogenase
VRFALSAEQRQFAATLHELLTDTPGEKAWPALAELGVTALAVPTERGGLGAGPTDLVVVFEELGHHAVPGPLVESLAAVPTLLAALGDTRWLPGLAGGDLVATLACPPHLPYAADADTAGLVLAIDGDTVRLVKATGTPLSSVDPGRRLFTVEPDAELAAGPEVRVAAGHAFDLGVLACAAELLGAGRAMLELAVGYVKQRTQFGKPIGEFQAVKHHLADVHVALELARPLLFGAALSLTPFDISAAKIATTQAAHRAARTALQVHGAIGYTLEYDLARFLTRVRALAQAWGTLPLHRARIASSLAAGGTK